MGHHGIPGWSPDLERSFKEVLFRFMEEIESTKAGVYLLSADGDYVLATQYGFGRRDAVAAEHHPHDVLVQRVREVRDAPFVADDLRAEPELRAYLAAAGSTRVMLVPLSGGSRLLGFVDVRDKARRREFERGDVERARHIAASLVQLIRETGIVPGSEDVAQTTSAEPLPQIAVNGLRPTLDRDGAGDLLASARDAVADGLVSTAAVAVIDREDAAVVVWRAAAAGGETDAGADAIVRHLVEAAVEERIVPPDTSAWRVSVRDLLTTARSSIRREVIASSVLVRDGTWCLLGSAVGEASSEAAAVQVARLGRVARASRRSAVSRFARRALAHRLLRPGSRDYPALASHSESVSRLCWEMARWLRLGDEEAEDAALAGWLHDVGMRELDYDRLYRHPAPGAEERRRYTQHVTVGERILRGVGMENVADAIRHHHERWDGQGYPDRLAAEAIPPLARLLHVAEVYDVLTGSHSYRRPVGSERALAVLRSGVNSQFDPAMVDALAEAVS